MITNQNKCKIDYINGQFEICPDTKKVHIQCCIIAEKPLTKEHWKIFVRKIFGNHCHVQERRHGNSPAARDYCRKNTGAVGDRIAGTEPFEYGEFRDTEVVSGGQGSRSDVTELRKWMKENPDATFQKAQDTFMDTPSLHTLITQRTWFLQEMAEYSNAKIEAQQRTYFEGLSLRSWQQEICNIVSLSPTPGDRTIHVIVCESGNSGKTILSSLLSTLHGFISLTHGKRDDILYAFKSACPNFTGVRGAIIDTPMSAGITGHDSRISVWQAAELLKVSQFKKTENTKFLAGISADDQQVCQHYSTPSADACFDHDESTRATRRVWRGASPYPQPYSHGSRYSDGQQLV